MAVKKWMILPGVLALLLAALAVWYFMATKDKREVKKLVENVSSLVSKKSGDVPHAGVFKFTKVDDFFCPAVKLRVVQPDISANWSRDELKTNVALMQRMIDELSVNVTDIKVELSDGLAIFDFDARISGAAKKGRNDFADVYRCSGSAEKSEGKWKISSLTAEPIVKK